MQIKGKTSNSSKFSFPCVACVGDKIVWATELPLPFNKTKSINCGQLLCGLTREIDNLSAAPKRLALLKRALVVLSILQASFVCCATCARRSARPGAGPAPARHEIMWCKFRVIICKVRVGAHRQRQVGWGRRQRGVSGGGWDNVNDNESLCSWQLVWWATQEACQGLARSARCQEDAAPHYAPLACTAWKLECDL